jgi:hypothetical protein
MIDPYNTKVIEYQDIRLSVTYSSRKAPLFVMSFEI